MLWSPPGDSVPPAGRASINADVPRALRGGQHDQCSHGVASSVVELNEHEIVGVARDHVGADAGVGERSADKVQFVSLLLFQRLGPVLSLSSTFSAPSCPFHLPILQRNGVSRWVRSMDRPERFREMR